MECLSEWRIAACIPPCLPARRSLPTYAKSTHDDEGAPACPARSEWAANVIARRWRAARFAVLRESTRTSVGRTSRTTILDVIQDFEEREALFYRLLEEHSSSRSDLFCRMTSTEDVHRPKSPVRSVSAHSHGGPSPETSGVSLMAAHRSSRRSWSSRYSAGSEGSLDESLRPDEDWIRATTPPTTPPPLSQADSDVSARSTILGRGRLVGACSTVVAS
mmetsp:Transcript_40935/g.128540  ORF Transcript_40935/g.128540 Transcript_40935/m.128540 type:complete len:219 (+) Transcript_40935:535-1191(+)